MKFKVEITEYESGLVPSAVEETIEDLLGDDIEVAVREQGDPPTIPITDEDMQTIELNGRTQIEVSGQEYVLTHAVRKEGKFGEGVSNE